MLSNRFLAQIPRILKIPSPQIGQYGMDIGASGTDHGFPAVARDPSPALAGWAGSLTTLASLAPMPDIPKKWAKSMYRIIKIVLKVYHFSLILSMPRDVEFVERLKSAVSSRTNKHSDH
jgi:hypothetical protein